MTNKPNDVRVSRELLERVCLGDASKRATASQLVNAWAAMGEIRSLLAQPSDQQGEPPRATEKDIERWHALIAESPEGPWVMGNGGSFDRQGVKPISDELMSELGQWLRMGYTPWNGRSVSPSDRQFMYLLYYSVQGLVSRVRRAERDLHSAQPATAKVHDPTPNFTQWFNEHGKEALQYELGVEELMEGAYEAGFRAKLNGGQP